MMNMADMFGKIQDMQKQMERVKSELGLIEVTSEVGGGMVRVTANGNRELMSISIDKDVLDPNDPEMLEDLIVAGVNKALAEADRQGKEKMAEITKSMLPPGGIPGMDMSKFGL
jgi:DNA-binding YbaB/EbfC family protein